MNRAFPLRIVPLILFGLLGCSSAGGVHTSAGGPPPDSDGDTGGQAGGPPPRDAGHPTVDASENGADTGADADETPIDTAPAVDLAMDVQAPRDTSGDTKRAADSAASDANGTTDGSHYNPCPAKGRPCAVLPLGDSLTQGAYSSTGAGYRGELFRQAVVHNQSLTFVGAQASGPAMLDGVAVPFPRHHEGHGGFTIEGISTWLTQNNTIATFKPDVVLLHIGTNNGLRHPGPNIPAVLDLLGKLIDQIVAADPHLLVIVAQIIPSKSDDGVVNTAAYNAGIPAVVAARANAGKHVIIADIHSFFVADPNWKVDYLPTSDVHPIDPGYAAMGRGWYSVLGAFLR